MKLRLLAEAMLYPARCGLCGRPYNERAVCPDCEKKEKRYLHEPFRLPESEYHFRSLSGAGSLYYYEEQAAKAVVAMKYCGESWRAAALARRLAERFFEFSPRGDFHSGGEYAILKQHTATAFSAAYQYIVPVPPSRRRGEQHFAGAIARQLSEITGVPCVQALYKARPTPRQEDLDRDQRLKNLWGSFAMAPGVNVENCAILLVDDVITTGTTASACARTLVEKGGADSVFAVSIAAAGEAGRPRIRDTAQGRDREIDLSNKTL